jgi:DMSO/TMAO reductase YedYZ molybdopterin-dependent catalytic subunit
MSEGFFSRGFRGRRRWQDTALPSGQYLVHGFPVLSASPTPHTPLEEWDFSIVGEVDEPKRWTWEEFRQLPSEEITKDIHCETKWSKLDAMWEGVSVDVLLEEVETAAEYVTAFCDGDYTTNLPLEDVTGGKACGAMVYEVRGLGTIIRCPSCDNALIRLAHDRGRHWIDLRGIRYLQVEDVAG